MTDPSSLQAYEEIYDISVNDILCHYEANTALSSVLTRLERLLCYTIPLDSYARGHIVVLFYKAIKGTSATPEMTRLSCILGWCWQMMVAYYQMLDEILDDDESRYGKPTWHSLYKHDTVVFNDTILLYNSIYFILRKYFQKLPCYVPILEYLSQLSFDYSLGQSLECNSSLEFQSLTHSQALQHYKSFTQLGFGPIKGFFQLSMILAGCSMEGKEWQMVTNKCTEVIEFQALCDDYNDSFGDATRNPLVHRDIVNGRVRWPFCKALELCDEKQKGVLLENYGKTNAASVSIVLDIYKAVEIVNIGKTEIDAFKKKLDGDFLEMASNGDKKGSVIKRYIDLIIKSGEY